MVKHKFGEDSNCKICGAYGPDEENTSCVAPITPAERARLRELDAKAMPGPWKTGIHTVCGSGLDDDEDVPEIRVPDPNVPGFTRGGCLSVADVECAAAARNSIAGYEAALELAIEALRRHGHHLSNCHSYSAPRHTPLGMCDCGLSDALDQLEPEDTDAIR